MIATFTPCMNYITGSSANGSSPTSNCCDAFKSVMSNSVDCGCLLLTAGIPLPQLGNNTMALGLTRFCKGVTVPVQCQASGSPLPAPGPPQFGTPPPPPSSATRPKSPKGPQQFGAPPPSSAFSPQASKATAATPIADQPAPQDQLPPAAAPVDQLAAPPTIHRVRPVLTPSASSPSMTNLPIILLINIMGFIMFKL
ncbi:non-specific lipid transfer protein GPI-anchored 16-like [Silene latifolia]|uniref:non-specific lipid transfer protein GPI-anchored 16-like n=1 Tax=Silene latifolia TaxID=37657 RepID=UPI003D789AE5